MWRVYTKDGCHNCETAKNMLNQLGISFTTEYRNNLSSYPMIDDTSGQVLNFNQFLFFPSVVLCKKWNLANLKNSFKNTSPSLETILKKAELLRVGSLSSAL